MTAQRLDPSTLTSTFGAPGPLVTQTGALSTTVSISIEGRIRECGRVLELDPRLAKEATILFRIATRMHADRERWAA
jgi:hypothetical protein